MTGPGDRLRGAIVAAVLLSAGVAATAQDRAGSADAAIQALQGELQAAGQATSKTRRRRALKEVIRKATALLEASPAAPNRFRVLAIVLDGQQRLLGLENTERNRAALFATCTRLARAPDEFAGLRLEADLLLSERDLAARNADVQERTAALAALLARYRDTPGEAKSLMMASLIAPKLEAFELEKQIRRTLDQRFAGDYDVIEWRRKNHGNAHQQVLFTGTYARPGGGSLSFPLDTLGHTCVMVFWSAQTAEVAARLASVQDLQARFPGQLEVFSFNVDGLPDGGARQLRAMGFDWRVMALPGGRQSQTYRVVARQDPIAVRVNAHGHAFLPSTLIDELTKAMAMEQNLDDPRYLAQLQSLLVGDFLVDAADPAGGSARPAGSVPAGSVPAGSVPAATLAAIRAGFVPPPMRYRRGSAFVLAGYANAEQRCRAALAEHPDAPDLWRVRNLRILALLGMWKLALAPQHLAAAVAEARAVLGAAPPAGATVVPRFCLAKQALRQRAHPPRRLLSELVEAAGAGAARTTAYAAAAILALEANAVDLHATYRQKLLESPGDDPALWPVRTFLLDPCHRYRLFQANYYMPPSMARRIERAALRRNAAAVDPVPVLRGPLEAELVGLDGAPLRLPQATDGKATLLMFVEPPADPAADFPVAVHGAIRTDPRGRKIATKGLMQHAFGFAAEHVDGGLQVIAAFLTDDRARVQALMQAHRWPCRVALVPGGLGSPLVRRLGILSADRLPNAVLLRPDGTIAWRHSGIVHPQLRSEGVGETLYGITLAIRFHLHAQAMAAALAAFEQGDYPAAVRRFSGPFPLPAKPRGDAWTAPRLHGRALAHLRLNDPAAALVDLDAAIAAHQRAFSGKQQCVCQRVAKLRLVKAKVLEALGRGPEAEATRRAAATAKMAHGPSRAGQLHDRLDALHRRGAR